ncbi:MAG: hypothetical protein R2706_16815 [Acidimicrobiales bacterium]
MKNGSPDDGNFTTSDNWSHFFTSRLTYLGVPLLLLGIALAIARRPHRYRSREWSPQSGGTAAIGAVL